jgi:hypothetical protein
MTATELGSDVDLITCVRIGQVAHFCKHGNETSDSTKCGVAKDSAPCSQSVDQSVISAPFIPKYMHNESRYCGRATE